MVRPPHGISFSMLHSRSTPAHGVDNNWPCGNNYIAFISRVHTIYYLGLLTVYFILSSQAFMVLLSTDFMKKGK